MAVSAVFVANKDILDGRHANQHIPQFLGYLRIFEQNQESDRRAAARSSSSSRIPLSIFRAQPPLSILIAAFNEEDSIRETLESLSRQHYEGDVQILVIDDGSSDRTPAIVLDCVTALPWPAGFSLELLQMPQNGGKAKALTTGLDKTCHDLVITLDADTMVFRDALTRLVCNHLTSPPNTAATAGTVLVRNSRVNLLTKLQASNVAELAAIAVRAGLG